MNDFDIIYIKKYQVFSNGEEKYHYIVTNNNVYFIE